MLLESWKTINPLRLTKENFFQTSKPKEELKKGLPP